MKVKELIKELSEFDGELDVCVGIVQSDSTPWSTVEIETLQYLDVDDEERGVYIEVTKPKVREWR